MIYNINLDIATAKTARAVKWKNTATTWERVVKLLSETTRTDETIKAYFAKPKADQDLIKDVGGFVGGRLSGGTVINKRTKAPEEVKAPYGVRRSGHVEWRQLVALDVDYGDVDTWLDWINLNYAGMFYTTHKHRPSEARFRMVFPLDRPVSADEYEAIARTVAKWLGIDKFDDTTYQPTRLMYYPSTSKDGEFLSDYLDAPIMSADDVLAEIDDWTDPTTWPRSSREKEVRESHGGSVEDPETKGGIVGAFCRAFDIPHAIDEFLNDVYERCPEMGDDRYSYTKGSTSGGLVLYNSDRFAFSNHSTDPAGGRLCNSFDLVRLHKFGELDERAKSGDDVTKLPSFKAMADFASNIGAVKKLLMQERRAANGADEYADIEAKAAKRAQNDDWVELLEVDKKSGICKNTINNVVLILANDENLTGAFAYNEFEAREVALKRLPWDKKGLKYPRPLRDADDAELRLYFERAYGITGAGKISDGLVTVVYANSYHPVKDFLDACEWDGEARIETILCDLFGVDDTPIMRAITCKWFVAGVARIYEAGCKFDEMLLICGEQGRGKSTFFERLGGDWYNNSITTMEGTKGMEAIQGTWIGELAEMAGMRNAQVEEVKHFVAKRIDQFRVAYGKRKEYFPRTIIFGASSNRRDVLRDSSGNRRFWIADIFGRVGRLDVWEYLTPVMVALLWGEAKARYIAGEQLYLSKEFKAELEGIHAQHMERDDRLGLIEEYLELKIPTGWYDWDEQKRYAWLQDPQGGVNVRTRICVLDIWVDVFGKAAEDIRRIDSFDIMNMLRQLKDWQEQGKPERIKPYGIARVFYRRGSDAHLETKRPAKRR